MDFISDAKWQLCNCLGISVKVQYSLCGATDMKGTGGAVAGQMAATLGFCGERIRLHAGLTCYDVNDWETRMYFWEYGLPQTFSSSLLYGSGVNLYCVLNLKLTRSLSLYLKVDRRRGRQAFRTLIRCRI